VNLLGHLYFSNDDLDLMYANLFGDYVKGTKFFNYPDKIVQGILLHRSIDSYFDQHQAVLNSKRLLFNELPKVSAVAMDLFMDHLLAKNWEIHHSMKIHTFLIQFYNHHPSFENYFSSDFQSFIKLMRQYKWLNHYHLDSGLEKACHGISSKISFENELHKGLMIFKKYEAELNSSFNKFMKDAKNEFLS
jgi:acyl carrier protein phosphodiesterase